MSKTIITSTTPPTTAPLSDVQAEIARLRAENAAMRNKLATDSPSRAAQGPKVQLNLLGTTKANGKENTGYVTLFAGDGPDGKSLGVASGTVSFWRATLSLLGAQSTFAQEMLAAIATHESNLKP